MPTPTTNNVHSQFVLTEEQKTVARQMASDYREEHIGSTMTKINRIIDGTTDLTIAKNNIIALLLDTQYSAFLWGVTACAKEPKKFGFKPAKKQKVDYIALFGNLVEDVIDYLNLQAGTSFRPNTRAYIDIIGERAMEGYTLDNFKMAIDRQCAAWLESATMCQHLNPFTLFGKLFPNYVHGTAITGGQSIPQNSQGSGGSQQSASPNNGQSSGKSTSSKTRTGKTKSTSSKGFQHLKRDRANNIPK